jgi:hypothetical protein
MKQDAISQCRSGYLIRTAFFLSELTLEYGWGMPGSGGGPGPLISLYIKETLDPSPQNRVIQNRLLNLWDQVLFPTKPNQAILISE